MRLGHAQDGAGRQAGLLLLLLALWPAAVQAAAWRVDPAHSSLGVRVFRAGAFASQLHDHHLVADRWSAALRFDPQAPAEATLQLSAQLDSLHDVEPGLSDEDHQKVEQEMRSPRVLDVQRFPEARFALQHLLVQSRGADRQGMRATLTGWLELHGHRAPLSLPVDLHWDAGHLRAQGAVTFKQSAFGIKPYKKLLGTVAVRDEVQVEVQLAATALP
ncbi:YceI family protein [Aggregicoccus sp. 17bor-14]|uniref:YceI family protein n=1 Tax=Myxococcaceae TaxID=31 RepID=UPI00129CFF71|nr:MULTISPECIES: YceI family protein [Myxococcaceae]MBF5043440.1 YceI family protein [Simulacricoccus sp. 17bor-14]MRI89198.1 YceI family protein [Aggregicoccus sp. 17bor-14]